MAEAVTVTVNEVAETVTVSVSDSAINGVPAGGDTGQLIGKASPADFDFTFFTPSGAGDMLSAVYDPGGVNADAFDLGNHTAPPEVALQTGDFLVIQDVSDGTIKKVPSSSVSGGTTNVFNEVPSGLINGSNATFTTTFPFVPSAIRLWLNGIRQRGGGEDYNNTDAQTIVFTTSPQIGDIILIDYQRA